SNAARVGLMVHVTALLSGSYDAAIAQYQETLESIKNGTLYSKDSEDDGDSYAMIPPTEDVESDYSVDVIRENGESVHIGGYSSDEELDQALENAVHSGRSEEHTSELQSRFDLV